MSTEGAPLPLTIVGVGQVATNRIIPALKSEPASRHFHLRHAVDVLPEGEMRARLKQLSCENLVYHRAPLNCENFGDFLRSRGLSRSPLIVASPSSLHTIQAVGSIQEGCPTAIEKPLASDLGALETLGRCTQEGKNPLAFPLGYYLLEKALPLLALARSGQISPTQLSLLSIEDRVKWRDARAALGKLVSFRAIIQEGPDDRLWPRNPANGGHTLETLSHLIALAVSWSDGLKVQDLVLARTEAASHWGSENVMLATLRDECGARFAVGCHKAATPPRTQRWAKLVFERGHVFMDMDRQLLRLQGINVEASISLTTRTKYLPQLLTFAEKIRRPSTPTEYAVCSSSVSLTLNALDSSRRRPLQSCGETWLEDQFQ